jgi:hypothetical protein
VRNPLWRDARAVPSLDLDFAGNKSLVDRVTGQSLVSFARAAGTSGATFTGSDGVLRTAVSNLLLRSEAIATSPWFNSNVTLTNNTSDVLDPVDGSTATKVVSTGSSSAFGQPVTLTAAIYAGSVWLRSSTGNISAQLIVYLGGAPFTNIGTTNVTITTTWQRFSVITSAATAASYNIQLNNIGAGTVYAWGAQLEQASTVGEYIPTAATTNSAPRFDHNPTTGESLGLLVEEPRTNSIRNNTMVGAVAGTPGTTPTNWFANFPSNGLSRQIVGTGTEGDLSYIDIRYSGTTSAASLTAIYFEGPTQVAAVSGQTWTDSAYVSLVGGSTNNISNTVIGIDENNNVGVYLTGSATNFTPTAGSLSGKRFAHTRTLTNASTVYVRPYVFFSYNSGAAIDITLRIGLPQLELGAFATSVIPTTTATATRAADVASITGAAFSSFYNQAEGTMYGEGVFSSISTNNFLACVDDATSANRWGIWKASSSASLNFNLSGSGFSQTLVGTVSSQLNVKIAGSASIGYLGGSFNGSSPSSRTDITNMPVVTQFNIGRRASGAGEYMNGTIKRLVYWNSKFSNTTLQSITQP